MIKRICLFLLLSSLAGFAQTPIIDSLKNVLKTSKEDTNKVNTLFWLGDKLWRTSSMDSAMLFALEGETLALKLGYKKGQANCMNAQGLVYWQQGNYPQALTTHLKALKIREEIADRKGIATSYNNIGNVYWNQSDLDKALSYHQKALAIRNEMKDNIGMAGSYNNIGILFIEKQNYPEALKNFTKSVELREKTGDRMGMATAYNNIGIVYENDRKFKEAYEYYSKALEIREVVGDKNGIANSLSSIGNLLAVQKKFGEARKYVAKAQSIALQLGNKRQIATNYMRLATLDSADGNYKSAYTLYRVSIIYRDSLVNEANTKKSVEAAMNYEFEKKEAIAKAEQEKKDAVALAESHRQKLITWAISGFGVLILIFAIFAYRSYLQKQKANKELALKNDAIAEQKKIVEAKNILITDSIEYAKSIQDAILPSKEFLEGKLGEYFVFFRPKDLVSGDFYWAKTVKNKIFVAAIDCTGHGVPGAFMSLMAFNMLENIIIKKEFSQPSLILDELNAQVLSILNQQTENASAKYGMDISLVELDREKGKIEYAGAHNPLLIVSNGKASEIRADKTTIGMAREKFTNHTLRVQKGDMLYMFTDGYPDQKGGPDHKKFFAVTFKELLISVSSETCGSQEGIIQRTFDSWKGGNEQIDDVLVMGIRV